MMKRDHFFDDPMARDRWQQPGMLIAQWAGVLLGPLAWATHLQVSYTLSALACADNVRLSVHATTLVMLALAATGGWFAWRNWRAVDGVTPVNHRVQRSRFMAISGIVLSAFFGLVIVAQWIPTFFIEPCRY